MPIVLAIDGAIVAFASDHEYRIIENINLCDAIHWIDENSTKDW